MTLTSSKRILARLSSVGSDSRRFLRKKLLTKLVPIMSVSSAIQVKKMHSFFLRNAELSRRMMIMR